MSKVIWITGASAGIGEATALEFAKDPTVKLVLSARRVEELERVKDRINLPKQNILILPMDVTEIEHFEENVKQIIQTFGQIDVLFNNAGISQRGSVAESKFENYRTIMEINFFGVVALTKAVLPIMQQQQSGHIAVTSSISGKLSTPMRSGYCASKHALHGFFDALRAEVYEDNIGVTMVCPGYIRTDISKNALSADGSTHGKMDENQLKGLSPEKCATEIVRAIKTNKEEIYIGGKEVLGIYLKRFFPKILSNIVRKQMPK